MSVKTWGKNESAVYGLCIACGVLNPLGRVHADYAGPLVWGPASCLPNPFPFLLGFSWTTFPSLLWKEVWPYNETLTWQTSRRAHGCQAGDPLSCFLLDCWPDAEDPREDQGPRKPPDRKILSATSALSPTSCRFVLHGQGVKFFCAKLLRMEFIVILANEHCCQGSFWKCWKPAAIRKSFNIARA